MLLHRGRQAAPFLLAPRASFARSLSCCAEAEALAAPVPGSAPTYDAHVLVRLPTTAAGHRPPPPGSSWPQLVEREPAVQAAFAAIAKHQDLIRGRTIKITAFEELPSTSGAQQQRQQRKPGTADVLAFPSGLRWDGLAAEQVGLAVALAAADNPGHVPLRDSERRVLDVRLAPVPPLTLLVCCHAARDSRCDRLGLPLAAALQSLAAQRGAAEQVQVLATSHVGGHKYAGNVVCYSALHPCDGDWFGGVNASNAASFLDALLGVEVGTDGGAEAPGLRPFWRGRMGLSKEEQRQLWEQGGAIEELGSGDEDDEEDDGGELEREMRQWERRRRGG